MRALSRALDEGLIRHVAMSSHWPAMYLQAVERLPLEAVLIWGNYLDFCNFPEIPQEILPGLRARGVGILFMKPLADGFPLSLAGTGLRLCPGPGCGLRGGRLQFTGDAGDRSGLLSVRR